MSTTPEWELCAYCQVSSAPEPPLCTRVFSYKKNCHGGTEGYKFCKMAFLGKACKYFTTHKTEQ